jgi:cell division protein FtsI/penicillin-binding protein 2
VSHSWFIGFAPYEGPKRIAFAVIVENGGYGGISAASLAVEIVNQAQTLKLIH